MTQTATNKNNGTDAKKAPSASSAPPATAKEKAPVAAVADGAAAEAADDADAEPKVRQQIHIVVGETLTFKNAAAAEKFLNKDPEAPKKFTVIKGKIVEGKAKVSLR